MKGNVMMTRQMTVYSLYCALVKASEEVVGAWEDEPLRPAIRMVRFTLNKYQNRRFKGKPLRDWNNHPDTTFEELKKGIKGIDR